MTDRVRWAVSSYGDRPPGLTPHGALCELLKSQDLYSGDSCKVVEFDDPALLSLLRKNPRPKRLVDLAPLDVATALSAPNTYIRRSDLDLEVATRGFEPIRPYWDRRLASDRGLRIWFITELQRLGLVSFRRRIR